jgi:hypothetical protein
MGSGLWSANAFVANAEARVRSGKDTFDYSVRAIRSGEIRVHQTLDPHGMTVRESRDSAEHPVSNAIMIGLDVTGSMDRVVRKIHADLPRLHELLLGQKYISDPQILFSAVGDATCDRAPLQVGQFESDNRMDQNLENIILERGGGGGNTESYELLLYTAARHTSIDCWEKRRRKGYLFIIGDEAAYPYVKKAEIDHLIGGGLQADLRLTDLISEVSEKFNVYFIIPGGASHGSDRTILDFWNRHLGPQRVIKLDSPDETSECIAVTIGIGEGAIDVMQAGHFHPQSQPQPGVLKRMIDRVAGALGIGHGSPDGDGRARRL